VILSSGCVCLARGKSIRSDGELGIRTEPWRRQRLYAGGYGDKGPAMSSVHRPAGDFDSCQPGYNWQLERAAAMPRQLSLKKKLLFSCLVLLVCYGVSEAICTAILPVPAGSIGADTFSIQEDTGGFCIDLIRGYSITKSPTRIARVSNGHVEFVGTLRGNSQGFQGDRDFTVEKPAGIKRRYLVFGDSFTSAAFLTTRWTERAEELLPQTEFVNCGIDGAGLANWWSVLTRLILPNNYQFDGVIFALIPHDLYRPFAVADHRCEGVATLGSSGWNPDIFPDNVNKAFGYMSVATFTKVTPQEFDASIREQKLCRGSNPHGVRHPWIAWQAADVLGRLFRSHAAPVDIESQFAAVPHLEPHAPSNFFGEYQMAMMVDIHDRLVAKHLPITVVYIPGRDELLKRQDDSPKVRSFASILGARFVDGSQPFRGLDTDAIRACYFPVDGHWNQDGSDRFAEFVGKQLKDDK
jgi:hypothetical protein